LAAGAQRTQRLLAEIDGAVQRESGPDDIQDAEVVEESKPAAGSINENFTSEAEGKKSGDEEDTTAASEGLTAEELEEL
jgi:hypothetical protein